MSSDSPGSGRDSLLSGNESLVLGGLIGLVLLALLVGVVLGFGNVVGIGFFLVSSVLYLAVIAVFLWLLYRIAVGVERIADAQERIMRTNEVRSQNDRNPRPDRE